MNNPFTFPQHILAYGNYCGRMIFRKKLAEYVQQNIESMKEKLFDVLTSEELFLVKQQASIRNVYIKDLTLEEVEQLSRIIWPAAPKGSFDIFDVLKSLRVRRAL